MRQATLADQRLQRFGQIVGDGCYSLLAAFAAQEHLRPHAGGGARQELDEPPEGDSDER